jgi:uncharacterized cupredoxin-like copper-binding protein
MRKPTHIFCTVLLASGVFLAACGGGNGQASTDSAEPVDREYELHGFIHGFYGKGGTINGVKNPVLTARPGETVRIILVNGETMPHDVALKQHKVRSREVLNKGERTSVTFTAQSDDTYYCTIPGHVQTGMIGEFKLIQPTAQKGPGYAASDAPPAATTGASP